MTTRHNSCYAFNAMQFQRSCSELHSLYFIAGPGTGSLFGTRSSYCVPFQNVSKFSWYMTQRSTHLNLYPFNANFTTLIPYFLCTMHQISLCTDFSVCVQSVAFTMVTQCAYGSWVIILNSLNRCKIEKSRLCVLIQKLFSLSR